MYDTPSGCHRVYYQVVYQVSIVELSTIILVFVGIAWAVTQVFTIFAARWVLQGAKDDAQDHREGVVEHFDEQLETVKEGFENKLGAFEERFSKAYKTDMETIQTEMGRIPKRIAMTFNSEKGAEVRALQGYLDKEGVDVDQAVEAAQGQFIQDNPEAMAAIALKRAYDADVSDVYRAENPIKAGIFDFAKASFLPQLEQAFLGTAKLGTGRKKGNVTNPYGL